MDEIDVGLDCSHTMGGLNYFESLPNEMMFEIFRIVEHPKDLWSCVRVSRRWECILFDKMNYINLGSLIPSLSKYLSWNSVLSLRKVCRGWRQAVDSYLDGKLTEKIPNRLRRLPWMYPFNSCHHLEQFMLDMQAIPPSHNPILDRQAVLRRCFGVALSIVNESSVAYWSLVPQFLQTFGHHIWFSRLDFSPKDDEEGVEFFVEAIWKALPLMPNLKELEVCREFRIIGENDDTEEELERVKNFMEFRPLPRLSQLTKMILKDTPTGVALTFLDAYGDQLESLILTEVSFPDQIQNISSLRKLKSLHILAFDYGIPLLRNLLEFVPPTLRKLCLIFRLSLNGENDFLVLIQLLRRFSETLEELVLGDRMERSTWNWDRLGELNLGKLKKFTNHCSCVESYDFLPGISQCLEQFTINAGWGAWTGRIHVKKKNSLGIPGFGTGCICSSRIWEIIPTLKSVRIQVGPGPIWPCSRMFDHIRTCTRRANGFKYEPVCQDLM